ncbi:type III PLP-dependent enzyme [Streptacidiphilus sp. P02-A3a]|nr:type III PLP-dependent enzyme [Streptacidiphilus sp. P02-A3a]
MHADLVRTYGTPQYVYRLDRFRAAAGTLRGALPPDTRLYYSLKANPHPGLAAALPDLGLHAEISSQGELDTLRQAGTDPADSLYTGPAKTSDELLTAIRAGVRLFSVESPRDLARLTAAARLHGTTVDYLVRLNAQGNAAGSGLRMTGRGASQFGIDAETVKAGDPLFTRTDAARPVGVHLFPATNVPDQAALIREFDLSIRTAAAVLRTTGLTPRLVDIGGGFPAPFARPGPPPTWPALRQALERSLDAHLPGWRAGAPQIAFESGRRLAADCGTLLTTVLDVKDSRGTRYLVLDAGINVLGGMSGLGRVLSTGIQPRPTGHGTGTAPATLVGPLCSPLDVLGRKVDIEAVEPGTVLEIPNVGAYGLSASLVGFLSRPMPAEVLLDTDTVIEARRLELTAARLARPAAAEDSRD